MKKRKKQSNKKTLSKTQQGINNKTILIIIAFFVGLPLTYYFIEYTIYNNAFGEGYDRGHKDAIEEIISERYPLQINVPSEITNVIIGDNINLKADLVNPTKNTVFFSVLIVKIPPDIGLEYVETEPTLICNNPVEEVTKEIIESGKYSISSPRRDINIEFRTFEIGPETTKSFPVNTPIFASKSGDYMVNYCIAYTDGKEVCLRDQIIHVSEK